MKKSEIFDIILNEVVDVCEVTAEDVLNVKRTQSAVDARVLVVQYCRKAGLSNDDIAKIVLRKTDGCLDDQYVLYKSKGVERMYYSYLDRMRESYAFGLMDDEICEYLKTKYGDIFKSGMKKLPAMR